MTKPIETVKYYKLDTILKEHLPVSKTQFYEYIKSNFIPKPVKIGKCSFWEHDSLMKALKELPDKVNKKDTQKKG